MANEVTARRDRKASVRTGVGPVVNREARPRPGAAAAAVAPTETRRRLVKPAPAVLPLGRTNYLLMGAAVAVIVVAFTMMRIENEVDGVIALDIAPILLVVGYLGLMPWALLHRDKNRPTVG